MVITGTDRKIREGTFYITFSKEQIIYVISSFFRKKPEQKWPWTSSDKNEKNECYGYKQFYNW